MFLMRRISRSGKPGYLLDHLLVDRPAQRYCSLLNLDSPRLRPAPLPEQASVPRRSSGQRRPAIMHRAVGRLLRVGKAYTGIDDIAVRVIHTVFHLVQRLPLRGAFRGRCGSRGRNAPWPPGSVAFSRTALGACWTPGAGDIRVEACGASPPPPPYRSAPPRRRAARPPCSRPRRHKAPSAAGSSCALPVTCSVSMTKPPALRRIEYVPHAERDADGTCASIAGKGCRRRRPASAR